MSLAARAQLAGNDAGTATASEMPGEGGESTRPAGARAPSSDKVAFRLLRYFSIASFIAIAVAAVTLGFYYREIAVRQLIKVGEDHHLALARAFANTLRPEYLPLIEAARQSNTAELQARPEVAAVDRAVREAAQGVPVVKVKIFDMQGRTIYSSEFRQVGEDKSTYPGFVAARAGNVKSVLDRRESFYAFGQTILNRSLLGSYVPVRQHGSDTIEAVFELYSDVTPFVEDIGRTQRHLVGVVAAVLLLLYGTLFVIVKRADDLLKRQEALRKRNEDVIRHLANHDTLTALPNRNLFRDRLAFAIARAERSGQMAALMFLDLDRFKEINDSLGHATGDKLLQAAAVLLRASLRKVDTVARLGGDEFTLILENITDVDQVTTIAENIKQALSNPIITQEGRDIFVTASIGIALYPLDGDNLEALLQAADVAMYHAKEQGRNTYEFYAPALNAQAAERMQMEALLHRAIAREEFVLHYQPKVEVASGRIVGMEALIRWNTQALGLVLPGKFIPMAEKSGLIVPIGEWVLKAACAQAKAWQDRGYGALSISVNLSPRQFQQKNLVAMIAGVLAATGFAPGLLDLEITEGMIMHDADKAIVLLREVHALGVQLSIDDFGTGYSSLAYLKRLPVQTLKIDQSFVRDLTVECDDAGIVTAIIAMAHSLKLGVIAEGVETEGQLACLTKLRCEQYQGYYFSRPVPAENFIQLLQQRS